MRCHVDLPVDWPTGVNSDCHVCVIAEGWSYRQWIQRTTVDQINSVSLKGSEQEWQRNGDANGIE